MPGTSQGAEIYLGGFSESCHATRARKSSLIVPGGLPITVLHTVINESNSTGRWPATSDTDDDRDDET